MKNGDLRRMFLGLAVLAACFSMAVLAVPRAEAGEKVIAACMQGNQSGFVKYQIAAMLEYMKTNAPAGIRLDIVYADDDPARQQSQVEDFVSRGVDVLIVNPVDKIQSATPIDYAAEHGIPVITLSQMSDSNNVTAHVGSDDVKSGILQMERLLKVAPANPRVAYINAVLGHSAQVFREKGYKEVLAKHPEAKLVVADTADWSGEKALQLVENWIQIYPNGIDLIATQADCILVGAVTAVENAGLAGKILLAGIDCDMPILEKIKEGVVDHSLWNDGVGQGEGAIRLAIDAANGLPISDLDIPYEYCTKENVDQYIEKANARNALSAKYF